VSEIGGGTWILKKFSEVLRKGSSDVIAIATFNMKSATTPSRKKFLCKNHAFRWCWVVPLMRMVTVIDAQDLGVDHHQNDITAPSNRILSIEDYGAKADSSFFGVNNKRIFCLKDLEQNGESCDHISYLVSPLIAPTNDNELAMNNTAAFTRALNDVQPGDTVLVPDGKQFTLFGGVVANDKHHFKLDVAGSLHFIHDRSIWPKHITPSTFFNRTYEPGLSFVNCTRFTLTCSSKTQAKVQVDRQRNLVRLVDSTTYRGGIVNGNGKGWWDDVIAGRIHEHEYTRPRLIHIIEGEDVLVEKLTLLNSMPSTRATTTCRRQYYLCPTTTTTTTTLSQCRLIFQSPSTICRIGSDEK
jgi:hypothetical protein